jgi:hypothetical protein
VLARVPTGRLVVLGEPGSGKTMLMVRLVLDLLTRRASGGRVPFLASVASWNPAEQDLRGWLAAQLIIDHPALADPPVGTTEPTRAAALLARGLIVPVLDGLDEIPESVRGSAISRINDALRPGEHLVVTCRTQQYRNAVRRDAGTEATLRAASAVQLRPLDADAVRAYLLEDATSPVTKARWEPVVKLLGTETPVGQALSTPLMVGLARAIYNPRPGELAGSLRDPEELCSPTLTDRAAVESLLFDAFIPAAYRDVSAGRWKARDAERWLVFLARYLEYMIISPDLAWWQLPQAARGFSRVTGVMMGMITGIGVGAIFGAANATGALGGAMGTIVTGVVAGTTIAAYVIIGSARRKPEPVRGMHWRGPSRLTVWVGVGVGVTGGAGIGIWAGARDGVGTLNAAVGGAIAGTAIGIIVMAVGWLMRQNVAPLDLSSVASPQAALAADRRTGIAVGALVAVVLAAMAGAAGNLAISGPIAGVLVGVGTWVISSFSIAAWPSYAMTAMWLALRHRLPWSLIDFLVDGHRRGVLRQAGAVYQFRHIELQHRLANRDANE